MSAEVAAPVTSNDPVILQQVSIPDISITVYGRTEKGNLVVNNGKPDCYAVIQLKGAEPQQVEAVHRGLLHFSEQGYRLTLSREEVADKAGHHAAKEMIDVDFGKADKKGNASTYITFLNGAYNAHRDNDLPAIYGVKLRKGRVKSYATQWRMDGGVVPNAEGILSRHTNAKGKPLGRETVVCGERGEYVVTKTRYRRHGLFRTMHEVWKLNDNVWKDGRFRQPHPTPEKPKNWQMERHYSLAKSRIWAWLVQDLFLRFKDLPRSHIWPVIGPDGGQIKMQSWPQMTLKWPQRFTRERQLAAGPSVSQPS